MEWGTRHELGEVGAANEHFRGLRERFPEVPSAYVPSGKLPPMALVWLAMGAAAGVPAAVFTGLVLGGLTILLLTLVGGLLGLMAAACGRVLCVVALLELAIAVIGFGITFAGIGAVPAWIATWAGKRGKNRNRWAAMALAVPSAVVAFAIVFLVPQALAWAVGPADPTDDFAVSSLVHTFADLGWIAIGVYLIGFVVTMAAAALAAHEAVAAQKFCEACEEYMEESRLAGLAFDRAAWAFDALRRGGGAEIAPHLATQSGLDVEPLVFGCPRCQRGYFEGTAHARAAWRDAKGNPQDRVETWLCASIELAPEATRALALVKQAQP
ncbi:MAG: hypothetical protein U0234_04640 [Sandaracinus sp.]